MTTTINSPNELHNILKNVKNKSVNAVVALFWANWANGSLVLKDTFSALQEEYDEIKFLLIEADKVTALANHFTITKLPTVLFFKSSEPENSNLVSQTLVNPSSEKLISTVELLLEDDLLCLDNFSKQNIDLNELEAANKYSSNQKSQSVSKSSSPEEILNLKIKKLINKGDFMIFIKGMPNAAKCGFSNTLLQMLAKLDIKFEYFDILTDESVRQGIKKYSNWPTFPQIYFKGELLGGLDIFKEMIENGEIAGMDIEKNSKVEEKEPINEEAKKHIDPAVNLPENVKLKLKSLISQNKIMVFMKGDSFSPKCKFSKLFVSLMQEEGFEPGSYGTFDILQDEQVRQSIKIYSNWPTFPQLYVDGDLIGGVDIIRELILNGEFQECLGE